METQCILNNCRKSLSDNKQFTIPFKNPALLSKWLEKIPKNLYSVIKNPSYICENHFEQKFKHTSNRFSRLHPDAVPSIFIDFKNIKNLKSMDETNKLQNVVQISHCRFCLKHFSDCETQVPLDRQIMKQFYTITQIKLNTSEVYSLLICEQCFNSTQNAEMFKTLLIKNQKKLEETIKGRDNSFDVLDAWDTPIDYENMNNKAKFAITVKKELQSDEDDLSCNASLAYTEEEILQFKYDTESDVSNEHEFIKDWQNVSKSRITPDIKIKKFLDGSMRRSNRKQKSPTPEIVLNNIAGKTKRSGDDCLSKRMCDICGVWYTRLSFQRHYDRIHLNKKNFSCDICGYKVFKKYDLENHVKTHFKIKTHFCHICSAAVSTSTQLRTHLLVHKTVRDFFCDIDNCKASFKGAGALQRHKNIHLRFKTYECVDCLRKFTDSYKLSRHRQSFHTKSNPADYVPCPVCGKIFKTKRSVKNHMVYHKPPEFSCDICQKEFYSFVNLSSHKKIQHTGVKGFQCKYCSNAYFKNSHLNRHILTVHMKQKIFCQADGCEQSFPLKERYKNHIVSHHKNLGEIEIKRLMEGLQSVEVVIEDNSFELNE